MLGPDARTRALRVASLAWLAGWYWKVVFYVGHLREAAAYPVDVDPLPALLRAPSVAAIVYALPITGAAALWLGGRRARIAGAVTLAVAAAVACAHVELFNDATFVTSFWAALWLVWLVVVPEAELAAQGPRLARAVVALVFLGGAVGKLNAAYGSGEAFHHLYFLQKDSWPYPPLRAAVAPETLRAIATWFSRAVIAGELGLVVGPFVPHRPYTFAACAVMFAMVLVSTFYLFSVLACLGGILVAARFLEASTSANAIPSGESSISQPGSPT